MIPNKRIALQELEIAGELNTGQWTEHSKNVALAAYHIANNCSQINANTAYVLGLLHDIGKKDITPEQYKFIDQFLESIEYDTTSRRYGILPFTVERWNKTIEYKEFFERMMNRSVYSVLPDIEKCIF